MLVSVAGPDMEWQVGDEIDMTVQQARVWADGERGELVRDMRPDTPEDSRRRRAVETPE